MKKLFRLLTMRLAVLSAISCCVIAQAAIPLAVSAQDAPKRPKSEEILPETTVAYVQLENARDFVEKMKESTAGKMIQDERIAPLANELYNQAQLAYADVEDEVGLSLDEIQSLPAGEVCFAVIAPRRKSPAFVLMMDIDEESEAIEKALSRGRELAEENGATVEVEEGEEVEFETVQVEGNPVTFFRKDGTLVIGTNRDVLDDMIERWMDRPVEKVRSLKENRKFVTIMNRCRGTKETPPEIRFFVDPISLARSAFRGNVGAQAGLNFLPLLGLDGLKGIGGSAIFNEQEFESVSHLHVLLANPRAGLFEMMALKPANYEPQAWIPSKTPNYMTTSWDVDKMYVEFEKIFDQFRGEGSLETIIESEINEELGIDFKEDLMSALSGRVTYVQWIQTEPIAINGTTNAIAFGLKDPEKFQDVVDIFLERLREEEGEDEIEEVDFKGITYWRQPDSSIEERRERQRERRGDDDPPIEFRMPQPSFGIIGNDLIICDSPKFFEHAILVERGEEKSLLEDDEFENVGQKMSRLLGSDMPGAVFYSQPQETMRMMFEVAKSDGTMGFLEQMAEENKYAAGVRDAVANNPLPDFEEVKDFFQPSGAFITDDESGYHMLAFQMRPNEEDKEDDDE